jgi:adenylate cyclase
VGTRRLYRVLLLAAAAASIAVGLVTYGLGALKRVDLSSVDARFSIRGPRRPPGDLVFVKIDDTTFNELHTSFPFPRDLHARVIANLARAGAKVIAYDLQFTEPSSDPRQDNDLIEAVRAARNVVLATTQVGPGGSTQIFGGGDGLRYSRATPSDSNYPNDPGGVLRRMSFQIGGLTSFPVATAQLAVGHALKLPGGPLATAWIDFAGPPGHIRSISFSRVERGRFAPDLFRGKIAVVGASQLSLQDLHPTSTTGTDPMPGPEIHANAIDTALRGFPLRPGPDWLDVLLIVVLGCVAPLSALRLSPLRALTLSGVALAVFAVSAQLAFDGGTILSVVYAGLTALISMAATVVLFGITTAFEREQVRNAFGRFVPESVVDQVLDQAEGLRLGGVRREGTVMFSDLRGFTSFAEHLDPGEVIDILNRYLTDMGDAILDHGGTLVSYMGDGIMAVFGAPIEQVDHADRALGAACEMLTRLDSFNAWLREQGHGDGFKMGIGLNSGPVMSGNVGSERRLEYTAIGDTTNTAARLEGMTKGTSHQLFLANSTKELLRTDAGDLVPVGEFEVRGRQSAITLWALAADVHAPGSARPD